MARAPSFCTSGTPGCSPPIPWAQRFGGASSDNSIPTPSPPNFTSGTAHREETRAHVIRFIHDLERAGLVERSLL